MSLMRLAAAAALALIAAACSSQSGRPAAPYGGSTGPASSAPPPYTSGSQSATVTAAPPTPLQSAPQQPARPAWKCKGVMKKIGAFAGEGSYASDCLAGPSDNPRLNGWFKVGSLPHVLKDQAKPELSFDLLKRVIPADVVEEAKKAYASGSATQAFIKKGDVMASQGFGIDRVWSLIKADFRDRESIMWRYVVVARGDYRYLVGIVPEAGQPDGSKGCNNPTVVILKK